MFSTEMFLTESIIQILEGSRTLREPPCHLHPTAFDELLKQQIPKKRKRKIKIKNKKKEGRGSKGKGKKEERRKMWNKSVSSFVFHDVAGQLDLVLLARTPFSFVPPFQNSSFLSHPCTRTRMERMLTRPNERASTVSFIPIETFQAHPHFVSSHSFASFFFSSPPSPSFLLSFQRHRFSYVTMNLGLVTKLPRAL